MTNIKIPYGRGQLLAKVPEERLVAVIEAHENSERESEKDLSFEAQKKTVLEALNNPIGTSTLAELVKGKKTITIISSDHTRPVPSHITMPILLDEIRKGNKDAEITILIATGLHRATTKAELREKYGEKIASEERIIVHDCHDRARLRNIGTLPSGGKLELSTVALDAELLIAEGFIEPHFFAGFSGGRKSILPGIASYDCVLANHCSEFIANKNADYGIIKGNPIHEDMIFAARESGLAFILNVIIDGDKNILKAVAGDVELAHEKGCEVLRGMLSCERKEAPIVITSNGGYPMDQNLYQAAKGAATAKKCCVDGGVIILCAECIDGHGGEKYYRDFAEAESPKSLLNSILEKKRDETETDQWQSQILAKVMSNHRLIVVSSLPKELLENMGIGHAKTIDEALKMAEEYLGDPDARVVVIPNGINVLV